MKHLHLASGFGRAAMLVVVAVTSSLLVAPATARPTSVSRTRPGVHAVDIPAFQAALRPIGGFVRIPNLGLGWKPGYVPENWQPYAVGQWIWNDTVGWYFYSEEPWAEITFHYGRWFDDPQEGWVWFADTQWAPAWVEWRRDRSVVGWRPLPPEAPRTGSRSSASSEAGRKADSWVFVTVQALGTADLSERRIARERARELYPDTEVAGRTLGRGRFARNEPFRPDLVQGEAEIRSGALPSPRVAPVPWVIRTEFTAPREVRRPYSRPAGASGRDDEAAGANPSRRPVDVRGPSASRRPSEDPRATQIRLRAGHVVSTTSPN